MAMIETSIHFFISTQRTQDLIFRELCYKINEQIRLNRINRKKKIDIKQSCTTFSERFMVLVSHFVTEITLSKT